LSGIERNTIIDLTKSLDTSFIPFSKGKYTDPPLEFSDWSSLQKEGFRVSRLLLGTQSGTHIDAPAHFLEEGAWLEALSTDQLMGKYFLVELPRIASATDVDRFLLGYQQEKIIFLRTPEDQISRLTRKALQKILSLPPAVLVLSGEIDIVDSEPFDFHRFLARTGKFLVEDLDQKAAHQVSGRGEIFAFPLRLIGVSGSPCRVIVRMEEATGSR
jgi:arylformamidase